MTHTNAVVRWTTKVDTRESEAFGMLQLGENDSSRCHLGNNLKTMPRSSCL